MRRNIIVNEPTVFFAGAIGCWKISCSPGMLWPKGTIISFDMSSDGRNIEWQLPQTDIQKPNSIFALIDDEKLLSAKQTTGSSLFEFKLQDDLPSMHRFQIVIGGSPDNLDINSGTNRVQTYSQRKRHFILNIELPNGQKDSEKLQVDVRGNKLKNIKVLAPSYVSKGKRFDITVRFEDAFGNLTNNAPDDTLIELSHEHLRDNLNWRLFVHEAGFVNIPNLYLNEVGVYRIKLHNLNTGDVFFSPPIKCFAKEPPHLFWGLLRGETERFSLTTNTESALRFFRDERALNFCATSHLQGKSGLDAATVKAINQTLEEFNEEDRFVTFQGIQMLGEPKTEGLRHTIFAKENKQIKNIDKLSFSDLKKIYLSSSNKDILSIPIMTMADSTGFNFLNACHETERLVEIYNSYGSSEQESEDMFEIKSESKSGMKKFPQGSIRSALNNNVRVGFCAGGLDQGGAFSKCYGAKQSQYPEGLTAVMAKNYNSDSIFEALWKRSCYATTGERMIIGLTVSGATIGEETNIQEKPGLAINRHICGFSSGTKPIVLIEIIRNGSVFKSIEGKKDNSSEISFEIDDDEPLESICLKDKSSGQLFSYYYLKAFQEDGHVAWSSPIWVDCFDKATEGDTSNKKKTQATKTKK